GIKIKKQRTSIKLKMPPNKRQPDFSKSRSLVVFLKRVIIYRLQCFVSIFITKKPQQIGTQLGILTFNL
ncbi:MAG: hypothetical protein DUD28_12455, partial [Lactobacillus sp.]